MILDALVLLSALLAYLVMAGYYGGTVPDGLLAGRAALLVAVILAAVRSALRPVAAAPVLRREWIQPSVWYGLFLVYGAAQYAGIPPLSTVNRYATLQALTQEAFVPLAVFVFASSLTGRGAVRAWAAAFAVYVIASSSVSFYVKTNGLVGGSHLAPSPMIFFGSNSNQYGGLLSAMTPLCVGLITYRLAKGGFLKSGRLRTTDLEMFFLMVVVALITATIFWVEARGVMVLHLVLLVFVSAALMLRARPLAAFSMLGALLGGSAIVLNLLGTEKATQFVGKSLTESLAFRTAVQTDALRAALDRLWTGWGEGALIWVLRTYQSHQADFIHPLQTYNGHLTRLAETGLIGSALWWAALMSVMLPALRRIHRAESSWVRTVGACSVLGLAHTLALGLTEDFRLTPAYALVQALYLALTVRASHSMAPGSSDMDGRSEGAGGTPARRPLPAAGLVVILVMIAAGAAALSVRAWADHRAAISLREAGCRDLLHIGLAFAPRADEGALSALQEAARWVPDAPDPYALMARHREAVSQRKGTTHEQRAHFRRQVHADYAEAIRRAPTWPDTYLYAGAALMADRRRSEAAKLLEKGMELNPEARDRRLYAILLLLAEAERTRWPDERTELTASASRLLRGSERTRRPLTLEDHDYLANYDHVNHRPRRLSPVEEGRLRGLLEDLAKEAKSS
ncbi:MAG: hypothetical protein MOGMAGMI_00444 [Candidatus Omnitrophica bacterium]|nr:hypothetical protein [Candidatus Omnitrophota bacterium]